MRAAPIELYHLGMREARLQLHRRHRGRHARGVLDKPPADAETPALQPRRFAQRGDPPRYRLCSRRRWPRVGQCRAEARQIPCRHAGKPPLTSTPPPAISAGPQGTHGTGHPEVRGVVQGIQSALSRAKPASADTSSNGKALQELRAWMRTGRFVLTGRRGVEDGGAVLEIDGFAASRRDRRLRWSRPRASPSRGPIRVSSTGSWPCGNGGIAPRARSSSRTVRLLHRSAGDLLGTRRQICCVREIEELKRTGFYDRRVFFVRLMGFIEPTAARRIGLEEARRFEAVHEAPTVRMASSWSSWSREAW